MDVHFDRIGRVRQLVDSDLYDVVKDQEGNRQRVAKPGMEKILRTFLGNRVTLNFHVSGGSTSGRRDKGFLREILSKIQNFCDDHCSGFWTQVHSFDWDSDWNHTTNSMDYSGEGLGSITISFENEQDIAVFEKDCAVLLKLAH